MATDADHKKRYTQSQKMVLTWIFCGAVLLVCFVFKAVFISFPKPRLPTLFDRVVFTLRWLMVSLLSIWAGVILVANVRFATSAIDPLDKSGKKYVEMHSNFLQNTVEQFLLHSFGLIVLSTYLTEESMHWVPLLVILFVISRVLFYVGYSMHPLKRAVGFFMTFAPSTAVMLYSLYCLIVYGFDAYRWTKGSYLNCATWCYNFSNEQSNQTPSQKDPETWQKGNSWPIQRTKTSWLSVTLNQLL